MYVEWGGQPKLYLWTFYTQGIKIVINLQNNFLEMRDWCSNIDFKQHKHKYRYGFDGS